MTIYLTIITSIYDRRHMFHNQLVYANIIRLSNVLLKIIICQQQIITLKKNELSNFNYSKIK